MAKQRMPFKRIKKQKVVASLVLMFLLIQSIFIFGAKEYIIDDVGLLTSSEIDNLQGMAENIVESQYMEPVIVITDNVEGKTSMAYADDYFDYNGYGYGSDYEGILLLINLQDRILWISTTGSSTINKYEPLIDTMVDTITPYLTDGEFYEGCYKFLDMVSSVETSGKLTTFPKRLLKMVQSPIPYIIAFVIALISTVVITLSSKGKHTVTSRTYEATNSFQLTNSTDRFIREFTTTRKIETNKNGGGGSHTGSSGRSHGGGGGGF